ncbi:MAG: hypothetical protein JNM57_11170 [Cyclobacteriaceae bacterium]|nr:hypothetical protein [Cyclobacteriaceae bacterium]
MKKIFIGLCMAFIPIGMMAQLTEFGSFKIINTEIIYQKVSGYDSVTTEKLVEFLKTVPNIANVEVVNNIVQADLTDFVVDYKKFQFNQVAVPPIIQTGRFSAKISMEGRDNKYRVTLKSIQVKGDIGYKKILSPENLTNYACTNSGTVLSRDWCKPNTLGLLDLALTDRFLFKEQKKDGDW